MAHKESDIRGIVTALTKSESALASGSGEPFEVAGNDLESVAAAVTAAKLGVSLKVTAPAAKDPAQGVNRRIIQLLADAPRPPTLGGA